MNCSEKRVLVTGATGLIGKELSEPLLSAGYEVHALTIDAVNPANGFHWISANLFDESAIRDVMSQVKPMYLLNMAWATTGDYLTNPINYAFLTAGINLARAFVANGGKRAVYAGTCFEYRFKNEPLTEDALLEPSRNEYTFCKTHLREIAERIFRSNGVSFGYGRIFNAFGRGEPSTRLTGMIIDKLRKGEQMVMKGGPLIKDYVYSKDIARAFVALLDSAVEGPVNIATGRPVSIREFAQTIARELGREDLLQFKDDCANQPPCVIADVTRLTHEVGYLPRYDLSLAVKEICR